MPLFWAREFSEPDRADLVKTFVQASLEMPRDVFRVFFDGLGLGREIARQRPARSSVLRLLVLQGGTAIVGSSALRRPRPKM